MTPSRHRSYSQINQIRTCGTQFQLERVEAVPSRPSCPAVAGSVIHKLSERVDHEIHGGNQDATALASVAAHDLSSVVEEETVENTASFPVNEWKAYGRPTKDKPGGEDWMWWIAEGIPRAISAYIDWRVNNPWWELALLSDGTPAIEVPFDIEIAGVVVRGFIDRIFQHRDDGAQILFDIKSGQKPKTDEQLAIYSKATGIRWGMYVYALKTGEAKTTEFIDLAHWTDEKINTLVGVSNTIIEQGLFLPKPGEACFHCSVSYACDFAQAAI